ncbi:unnamed protein product, partial [Rotaria sordida]
MIGRIDIG